MIQVIIASSSSFLTILQKSDPFQAGCFHISDIASSEDELFSSRALPSADLIFLDLQLPGIRSAKALFRLREENPRAGLVLMSSRRSFSEAFAALQYGCDCFLLKPVPECELSLCLSRFLEKRKTERMKKTAFDTRCFIGKLFVEYAKKVVPEKQMNETMINDLYGTSFLPDSYRLITIALEMNGSPAAAGADQITEDCARAVFSRLEGNCHELLLNIDYLRVNVLLNYERRLDPVLPDLLRDCQKEVAVSLPSGAICTFCCSNLHFRICEIQEMLDEAVDAMWSRFYHGKDTVLYVNSDPPCSERILRIYEETEQQLKTACSLLDPESFQKALHAFFSRPDYIVGRHETRALLRRVEYYMLDVNRNLISSFTDVLQTGLDIKLSLRTANTLEDYKSQFADQLNSLFRRILVHHGQHSQPVRKAQLYIRKHYASPIRLMDVAGFVGLTPVYLSARFKEETGIGFSDYLNQYRIEMSKKLLAETDEKIVTIAHMAGYSNSRYYSRVFKNLEGIRPMDYRISVRKNGTEKD